MMVLNILLAIYMMMMYDNDDDDDRPLCIILPQMIGYIKYCDNGGKICLLKLKIKVYILNTLKSGIILKRT